MFKPLRFSGSMVFRKLTFIVLSVLLVIILTACGVTKTVTVTPQDSSKLPQEPSLTDQGSHHQVSIGSVNFVPLELYIKLGDTVTWVNEDTDIHTVTSWYHYQDEDDITHTYIGEFWDSGDIKPGNSFSRTFNQTGTYEYVSLPLFVQTPLLRNEELLLDAVGVVVAVE